MKEEICIICRRPFPLGLHIMGCMICFPCERRLVRGSCGGKRRRRLTRIFHPAEG